MKQISMFQKLLNYSVYAGTDKNSMLSTLFGKVNYFPAKTSIMYKNLNISKTSKVFSMGWYQKINIMHTFRKVNYFPLSQASQSLQSF